MAFVPPAFSTKALRVGDAEIQGSALIFFRVMEVDADAMYTGRHHKGDIEVGLILRTLDVASKHQIGRFFLLSNGPRCKPKREQHKTKTPKLHDVQINSPDIVRQMPTNSGVAYLAINAR
jgi:hypothetical protein